MTFFVDFRHFYRPASLWLPSASAANAWIDERKSLIFKGLGVLAVIVGIVLIVKISSPAPRTEV